MNDARTLERVLAVGRSQTFTLDELQQWGAEIGALLPAHSIITLTGDLGAGKTTLARALCVGAGAMQVSGVTSPTFSIVHEYAAARGVIAHADLYRIRDDRELDALGWDELVSAAHLVIVEWPERVSRPWPPGTLAIHLEMNDSPHVRQVSVQSRG